MACLGLVEERADRHHACVVDQHVDMAAAIGAGLVEERREGFTIGDVEGIARDLAELGELHDGRLLKRHVAVADDHPRSAGQQRLGGRVSDAAGGAGDRDGLAPDVVHAAELYMCQVFGGRGLGVGYPQLAIHPQVARSRPCLRSEVGSRIECMFESSDDVGLVAVIEETTARRGRRRGAAHGRDRLSWSAAASATTPTIPGVVGLRCVGFGSRRGRCGDEYQPSQGLRADAHRRDPARSPAPCGRVVQGGSAQCSGDIGYHLADQVDHRRRGMGTDRHRYSGAGPQWGPLAEDKLIAAVDALVLRFDRSAVIASQCRGANPGLHRRRLGGRGRADLDLGQTTRPLMPRCWTRRWRRWPPRCATTIPARRGAPRRRVRRIANGNDHLPVAANRRPARVANQPAPKSSVVVNVLTDQTAVDAARSACVPDQRPPKRPASPRHPRHPRHLRRLRGRRCGHRDPVGHRDAAHSAPGRPLAQRRQIASAVRPQRGPRTPLPAFDHSRISSGARDLTCRFPGCTAPAERCDIDHVVPYPIGWTHAANLACLCRKHHHLKTFWTGDWALTLLPDGAAIWTSPTGRTYTTHPGSRSHFPHWDTTAGGLPPPTSIRDIQRRQGFDDAPP